MMSNKVKLKRQSETPTPTKSQKGFNKGTIIILGIAVLLFTGFLFIQNGSQDKNSASTKPETYAQLEGDLKIVKSEVTSDVKIFPFKLGDTKMEVLALKADDGTVRTALNTCQVCYNSGKGYYMQDKNTKELVCQNCGNKFAPDKVEIIKGGCNPIPITKENKIDDGTNITISKALLEEATFLFSKWSRN